MFKYLTLAVVAAASVPSNLAQAQQPVAALDQTVAQQQYRQGLSYQMLEQDYAKALQYYRLAAQQGHTDAQVSLGVFYENGTAVKQDLAKAKHYYRLAAKQGNVFGQYNLAALYSAKADYAKAVAYYQLSADQGYKLAQYALGSIYHNGFGVAEDPVKAQYYLQQSCAQKFAYACEFLQLITE